MTQEQVLSIFKETLWIVLELSAPMLLISIIIGLVIAILQAATQIHEQTLTFVPKIIAVFAAMILCGSWMLNNMTELVERLWSNFSTYLSM